LRPSANGAEDVRAAELCAEAMRNAVVIAYEVDALPDGDDDADRAAPLDEKEAHDAPGGEAMIQLEQSARTLRELQPSHRTVTLSSVAGGAVTADEAMARVETVRRLDALAHYAWRSAAHLVSSGSASGHGGTQDNTGRR
jgi:phosphate:Na+ symporter